MSWICRTQSTDYTQFGTVPLENKGYGKIINEKHFKRICGLIDPAKVVAGGETNEETLQIAPDHPEQCHL